jgi:GTP-binding protein
MKIISSEFVISAVKSSGYPKTVLPEISFVGRSNVGKSSLMNALLNRKNLARTSKTPGRTQLINFFLINESFYFVDLPGYGFARITRAMREQWDGMMADYFSQREARRMAVLILDMRHGPTKLDLDVWNWLVSQGVYGLPVATKADKLSSNALQKRGAEMRKALGLPGSAPLIVASAKDRRGLPELWTTISTFLQNK